MGATDVEREHLDELAAVGADDQPSLPGRTERFYGRWEREQWGALAVDLSVDRDSWQRMPSRLRGELRETICELGGGDVAVTRLLTPLIDHAPHEQWRIFLATQLSDEVKHAVFFRRYAAEVFRDRAGTFDTDRDADLAEFSESAYAAEFEPMLREAVLALPDESDRTAAWYRASSLYHLITEGVLGVTVLRLGRAIAGSRRLWPGLAEAVAAIFRDEGRHVAFGRAAAAAGKADGYASPIAAGYRSGVAVAARVMVGPGRQEPDLGDQRWRERRGQARRARLTQALELAQHQASLLDLPVSSEELANAWTTGRDQALADYHTRWSRPHSADVAATGAAR